MSDVPQNATPVQIESSRFRSPVSEALIQQLGGNINYLLNNKLRIVEFLTSGSWPVPANLISPNVMVIACGGGGGGGAGSFTGQTNLNNKSLQYSAQGGFGSVLTRFNTTVVPSDTATITIGAGGIGGISAADGSAGGNTIFAPVSSPVLTFRGGPGGLNAQQGVTVFAVDDMRRITRCGKNHTLGGWSAGTGAYPGQASAFFAGGNTVLADISGGGGASDFGVGGNGGSGANGQTPASTSYGAGGGSAPSSFNGGAGIHGYLAIVYFGNS